MDRVQVHDLMNYAANAYRANTAKAATPGLEIWTAAPVHSAPIAEATAEPIMPADAGAGADIGVGIGAIGATGAV